jgi:nucleoid DNA-binding protein
VATVTKKEIVKQISEETGLTQLQTKVIVQMTFDAIIDALVRENRIELRKFGVFEVKLRRARRARNPRTNDPVFVAPKNVVTFQPGKEMEEKVKRMPLVPERPSKVRRAARAAAAAASEVPMSPVGELSAAPSENGSSGHGHDEPVATATVKKTRKRAK